MMIFIKFYEKMNNYNNYNVNFEYSFKFYV